MDRNKGKKIIRRLQLSGLLLTILFIISVTAAAISSLGTLDIYLEDNKEVENYAPSNETIRLRFDPGNKHHMIVEANGRGRSYIESPNGSLQSIYVLPGGFIYNENNNNFSGYKPVILLITTYALLLTLLFTASFIIRAKVQLFSYNTLYYAGAAIFLVGLSFELLFSTLRTLMHPETYHMGYIFSIISDAGTQFMTISLPFMLVFSIMLLVSNISLIVHEGISFVNILGFMMSGLIIASYLFEYFYVRRPLMGSEHEVRVATAIGSIFSTAFVYFEAMLLASITCGIIAAKKRPRYDKTHIVILGCAIASDGSPLPLLRGRIDRAIDFAGKQQAENGIAAKFVPSGGQGADEVISEAESIKRYLIGKGISEERIIPENRSVNTQENMRFSLEKIKADSSTPRIVFSTSNYHVLRSGIISENEGLDADGIGCRTKWYFWPNAFIREVLGLFTSKWKQHAFWTVFFITLIVFINMVKPM